MISSEGTFLSTYHDYEKMHFFNTSNCILINVHKTFFDIDKQGKTFKGTIGTG